MKKLHSLAFYALAAPVLTLGAGTVLAQQSTGQDTYGQQQNAQPEKGTTQPKPMVTPTDKSVTQPTPMVTPNDKSVTQPTPKVMPNDQSQQIDKSITPSTTGTSESSKNKGSLGQSDSKSAVDSKNAGGQAKISNRGFIGSIPAKGMHANSLIGAEVKTTSDENVGEVTDLIINETGHVVAVVVSVGGFLGMGEREVAIGWDDVTRSGDSDELELQIGSDRDALRSAPEFKKLNKMLDK